MAGRIRNARVASHLHFPSSFSFFPNFIVYPFLPPPLSSPLYLSPSSIPPQIKCFLSPRVSPPSRRSRLAMEICSDFLEWLGTEISTSVLMFLDDPADLVRVSSVCRSWRRFVVLNGFCKRLCLRICAEISYFACVIEGSSTKEAVEVGSSSAMEWANLVKEHRVYSYLTHCLISPMGSGECILKAIHASSTDNYPYESMENTLIECDRVNMQPSYWSSQGESDPGVPETLTYSLGSGMCVVNEIKIRPFEAYFHYGNPIYSAKSVRFQLGHSMLLQKSGDDRDENFVWTHVSPEFPMVQQNELQSFKLPRPVLCIGGILQIELLGRVQICEIDHLYYMCVCHVQVVGRRLCPAFETDIDDTLGSPVLKYFPERRNVVHLTRQS